VGAEELPKPGQGGSVRRSNGRDWASTSHDGERLASVLDGVKHVGESLGRVGSRYLSHYPIIRYRPLRVKAARRRVAAMPLRSCETTWLLLPATATEAATGHHGRGSGNAATRGCFRSSIKATL
jgi:hypothetical protein